MGSPEFCIEETEQSNIFYENFSKGLISETEQPFKDARSRKVLTNLAEFLLKEKKGSGQTPSALLSLSLKVHPEIQDTAFARNLYLLGHMFAREQLLVQAEGAFSNAKDILEKENSYEKVEMFFLFGNMLRQVGTRNSEAEKMIARGREEAAKMPPWYPYLVNLAVTEMEIN